jgi:hypothetical protein
LNGRDPGPTASEDTAPPARARVHAPLEPHASAPWTISEQIELGRRIEQGRRMQVPVTLGIGAALAVSVLILFAAQRQSFEGAGSMQDADLSVAKARIAAVGQGTADITGAVDPTARPIKDNTMGRLAEGDGEPGAMPQTRPKTP